MTTPSSRRPLRTLAIATSLAAATLLAGCNRHGPEVLMDKARTAIAAGEGRAAEIHLKNVLQRTPDDKEARVLLASVYMARRDMPSAEKEWQRALDLGVAPDLALPGLLEARVLIGDAKGALAEAARHTANEPTAKARIAYWTGRAHQALGQFAPAESAYSAALASQPDMDAARVGLASLKAVGGDRAGAESALDALLLKTPNSAEALLLKAELRLAAGDRTEARAVLLKAIAADPTRVQPRAMLVSLLADSKEYPEAAKQLDGLRQISPGHVLTHQLGALLEYRQGRLGPANDAVQMALRMAPDHLPVVALAGQIALAQGALELAESHARKVRDRAPDSVEGARLLAAVQLRRNDPGSALQTARTMLDRGAADPVLLGIAGEAALRRNDVGMALDYFERATRLDPTNAARRVGLGLAQLASGRSELGYGSLEAAVELDPTSTQADLALISARIKARQFDKALAAIDRLAKKEPDTPLADGLRGSVHLARNALPQARESFESALRRDATYLPAISSLVEMDLRDGKAAEARGRLEALLQKDPRNLQGALALAQLISRTGGKPEDVERVLKQAQSAHPGAVEPVLALARSQIQSNRARDAIPLVQQALGQHPDDRRLLEVLGTAFLRADQKQQGIETFERIVALDPKSPSMHQRMGEIKASLGDTAGATASFRQAAALDPKSAAPQLGLAAMLFKDGQTEQARRVAASLQKTLPGSPAGLALEGDLLAADKKWSAAADAYRKALAIERSAPLVVKQHAALRQAGRDAEAASALADALKAAPGDVALRTYAGELAVQSRQWVAAAEHYRAAVAVAPANVVVLNNLAWSLHELRDPAARKYAEEAHRLAPKSPSVIDTLAVIVGHGGDAKRAVELLKQAVELAPTSAIFRLHYAQALAMAGDRAAAREAAESLVQTFPESGEAARAKRLMSAL